MSRSAIALLSGGLDSGVAAALWLERGGSLLACLCFDYGQRAARREARAAEALARRFGAEFAMVSLPWLAGFAREAGCSLVDRERRLPSGTARRPGDASSAASVWVPARNVVLIAAAASMAEARGAGSVVAGFNREEAETFPDNSEAFVADCTRLLRRGTRTGVLVESPTLRLDKRSIVAEAQRMGLGPGDFWSCYEGGEEPCGLCESCARSRRAWGL
ncbi:MAG: 7-cyano-7-deazaguanine synthase QueC [Planctomycetota bacterium]